MQAGLEGRLYQRVYAAGRERGMAMSDTGPPYVGRSLLRREDRRLLMGQGQFVADLVLPRMLHAVLVRGPMAHAWIRAVDLSRAGAAPGLMPALCGVGQPGQAR